MDLRQLDMLTAVVVQGGYEKAGKHLHISHSAIHRQIRLLEEELGAKLFVRTGRSVQLTEVGRRLIDLAHKMRQEMASAEQQIRDMQQLVTGHLRIGTGTTTLIFFLPAILEEFRNKYPGVELYIVTGTADQLISQLQEGDLDIGLVSEPVEVWPAEHNLCYERLYEEEFAIVASDQNPLAKRQSVTWADLKNVPLISFPRASRIRLLIDSFFRQENIIPRIMMELENEEAIEKMILVTGGVGFIAKRRVSNSQLRILPVGNEPIVLNIASVHRRTYLSRSAQEFMRICRHYENVSGRRTTESK